MREYIPIYKELNIKREYENALPRYRRERESVIVEAKKIYALVYSNQYRILETTEIIESGDLAYNPLDLCFEPVCFTIVGKTAQVAFCVIRKI